MWRFLRGGQLLAPGSRVGTGVATLGSGARGLAGNSGDGTQSHIAGKWEGLGGSGRGLEGVGVDRGKGPRATSRASGRGLEGVGGLGGSGSGQGGRVHNSSQPGCSSPGSHK